MCVYIMLTYINRKINKCIKLSLSMYIYKCLFVCKQYPYMHYTCIIIFTFIQRHKNKTKIKQVKYKITIKRKMNILNYQHKLPPNIPHSNSTLLVICNCSVYYNPIIPRAPSAKLFYLKSKLFNIPIRSERMHWRIRSDFAVLSDGKPVYVILLQLSKRDNSNLDKIHEWCIN